MIVRDTVIVTDTKYLIDTLAVMKDTVIYQDKVRLQLQYIDRKVVVEAACEPDTIRIVQTKIVTKQEEKRKGWTFDQMAFAFLFVLAFAYFIKKWTLESYLGALAFILTFADLIKRWVDKLTE